MSLRWRWALSMTAVALVAVGATAIAGVVTTGSELRDQIDRDLLARFESARLELPRAAPRTPFDRVGRGEGPGRNPVELDAVLQITVGDALLFAGRPRLPMRSGEDLGPTPMLETVELDGTPYRLLSGTIDGPARDVVVQIARSTADADEAVAALLRRITIIGMGLAVVGGGLAFLLAKRAVEPIERLTTVTDTLTDVDDFDDSLLPTDAPGEVGTLAASFGGMLDSLRRSRAAQRRLVADAGHEFRTPLTALRTNLETLDRRGGDLTDAQRKELIAAAVAETKELSTLSAELVDLAGDVGREVAPVDVDLAAVAAGVAARFRSRTDAEIVVVVVGEGATVRGHPTQLDRAISNLVENAIKFAGGRGRIAVDIRGTTVTVSDDGPGIPVQDLPHVFDRFHRADEARSSPGSGLGLAIVEHIATAHGGTVFARNRPDGGAEVGFTLG